MAPNTRLTLGAMLDGKSELTSPHLSDGQWTTQIGTPNLSARRELGQQQPLLPPSPTSTPPACLAAYKNVWVSNKQWVDCNPPSFPLFAAYVNTGHKGPRGHNL